LQFPIVLGGVGDQRRHRPFLLAASAWRFSTSIVSVGSGYFQASPATYAGARSRDSFKSWSGDSESFRFVVCSHVVSIRLFLNNEMVMFCLV
jgi:hypothetical protein